MIDQVINSRKLDRFDQQFIGLILSILSIGVLSIYSVTYDQKVAFPLYAKQMVWMGLGMVVFVVMWLTDYHRIAQLAYPAFIIIFVLLVCVLLGGKNSHGAQRWISMGPVVFQPSEFAKLLFVGVLAQYFSKTPRIGWLKRLIFPAAFALPSLILILKQPDLGSGLSFLFIYLVMIVIVGVRSKAVGLLILFFLMLSPFIWEMTWASLHDYQQQRIMAFIDPTIDVGGKGYHALQSRVAIGSGELMGKGLFGGTQSQLGFLPEGHTDFIFAVFAEEWGFLGVLGLSILFGSLIWLSLEIAMRAKDELGVLLAVGISCMLCFGIAVNIGMTMGIFPIVGVPLPLMSYGGSAMIMTMAALGLLLSIKRHRLSFLQ